MRKYPTYPVIFMLIVSILANGLSLSFRGEVFAHELDHIRQALFSDLDAATHLCLHSAGQYQPFFFNSFPLIPDEIVAKILTAFVSAVIPETIRDLPLRPPRSTSFS